MHGIRMFGRDVSVAIVAMLLVMVSWSRDAAGLSGAGRLFVPDGGISEQEPFEDFTAVNSGVASGQNLLPPDVVSGPVSPETGLPPGWMGKASPHEFVMEYVAEAGGQCFKITWEKFARKKDQNHLPGSYRGVGLTVNRGERFRFSVKRKGTGWLALGVHLGLDKTRFNPVYFPLMQTFPPSPDGFSTAAFDVEIPFDNTRLDTVSFEMDWVIPGILWVTDFRLERLAGPSDQTRVAAAAHPWHRLDELSRRVNAMPFDRLFDLQKGRRMGERVVFRDTATGATLWRMTRGLGRTGSTYTFYPSWTADGKYMIGGAVVTSERPELCKDGWFERADGSEFVEVPKYFGLLNPVNGRLGYALEPDPEDAKRTVLVEGDLETMQKRVICRLPEVSPEYGGFTLSDIHPDGKMILAFVNLPPTRENKTRTAIGLFLSPEKGVVKKFEYGGLIHNGGQFRRKAGDYTVGFSYEWGAYDWGTERRTLPRGSYSVDVSGVVRPAIVSQDNPFLGDGGGGHASLAADGRGIAMVTWYGIVGMDPRGEHIMPLLRAGHGCNHVSWISDPDFLVADGPGKLGAPLYRIAGDGKRFANRIAYANTCSYNYPYYGHPFAVFSPDGTKIYYNSYMMGGENVYNAVARKPEPPRNLTVEREGEKAVVSWDPPSPGREIRGYQVYQAQTPGGPYTLLTPEPLVETRCAVDLPARGAAYVVVAAREWSGLLSGFSEEVCVNRSGQWEGPVRVVLEAERGEMVYPAQEQFFPLSCGNLYAAGMAEAGPGRMSLTARIPREGSYRVWLRVRSPEGPDRIFWKVGRQTGESAVASARWEWTGIGPVRLESGPVVLDFSMRRRGVAVDQVFLTTEAADLPRGRMGGWGRKPSRVRGIRMAAETPFRILLTWTAATVEEDIDHYNIYVSPEGPVDVNQSHLVGSPSGVSFLDWGLKAGMFYRYRVTAVDRWGVEGPASDALGCSTPAIEREEVHIPAGNVLEKEKPGEKGVEISFDVRKKGEYLLWVRLGANPNHQMDWVGRYWIFYDLDGIRRGWKLSLEPLMHLLDAEKETLWLSLGHGGDTEGFPFPLEAGKHTLRLAGYNDPAALFLHEIVVTNDLGYTPPGNTSFMDFVARSWGVPKQSIKGME